MTRNCKPVKNLKNEHIQKNNEKKNNKKRDIDALVMIIMPLLFKIHLGK